MTLKNVTISVNGTALGKFGEVRIDTDMRATEAPSAMTTASTAPLVDEQFYTGKNRVSRRDDNRRGLTF